MEASFMGEPDAVKSGLASENDKIEVCQEKFMAGKIKGSEE